MRMTRIFRGLVPGIAVLGFFTFIRDSSAWPGPVAADHAQASAPGPASEAAKQAAEETALLKAHFMQTRCMRELLERPPAAMPDESFWRQAYSVELSSSSELMDHRSSLVLVVRKADHQAYLIKVNGFDGTSKVFGAVDISDCLKP